MTPSSLPTYPLLVSLAFKDAIECTLRTPGQILFGGGGRSALHSRDAGGN